MSILFTEEKSGGGNRFPTSHPMLRAGKVKRTPQLRSLMNESCEQALLTIQSQKEILKTK